MEGKLTAHQQKFGVGEVWNTSSQVGYIDASNSHDKVFPKLTGGFFTQILSQNISKKWQFWFDQIIHLGFSAVFQTLGGGFKLWFIFVLPILVCLQSHLQYSTLPIESQHQTRYTVRSTWLVGSNVFLFISDPCGNDCQFDLGIFFQMGRKNKHQLEKTKPTLRGNSNKLGCPQAAWRGAGHKNGGKMSSLPGCFPS